LEFSEEIHDRFCGAECLFAVVVVSPEDGLVALEFDEFVVAEVGETVDYLVCLEPGAIQEKQIVYWLLDFTEGEAVFMGV